MNTEQKIQNLEAAISHILSGLGIQKPLVVIDKPSDFEFGDVVCNVAMRYSKELGKPPMELAEFITEALKESELSYLEKTEIATPGFINVTFSAEFYRDLIKEILSLGNNYGKNDDLAGQKWVIEHTSPNPNKAMHLGHLRNNLVGMGLVRLLKANGAEVISDAIDNNRGIAIAKLMWGYLSLMRKDQSTEISIDKWIEDKTAWYTPEEKSMLPDVFVTECYVHAGEEIKKDQSVEGIIREMVVQWEAGDKKVHELWSFVLTYAYEGMERTLNRLGSYWDNVWHEHEHYQEGKSYVELGLEKGIFKKLEDGAVLTDLEEKYGIPDTILLKKDGTSLYITQDIALTAKKRDKFSADRLLWVIGPEQSLAMKQLFAVCEQLGIGEVSDYSHVSYGYVGLKDDDGGFKKMSSRAGTVLLIDDLIDTVKEKIKAQAKVSDVDNSEQLAIGAVKFSLLKADRTQEIVFDPDQSVEISGASGIYVMYTYARILSVLSKGENVSDSFSADLTTGGDLRKILMFYPEIIKRSQKDLSVHHIAQYLLDLSSAFNSWYGNETLVDGSEKEAYRLALAKAVAVTIKNGLEILGIETLDRV
ncbi:arginine--tRNA ligase [Candidatus Kaiserbacteria bacterium]|nr:arginine--tRNA ligase [Candidatus Kaiserbacteria bacterium]